MTNENFVTIANFSQEWEVYMLSSALEAEGVRCFTHSHTMLNVRHVVSDTIGGIDLLVHQDDLEEAQRILKKVNYIREGKVNLDVIYKDKRYQKVIGFCPKCDENTVYRVKPNITDILMNLFFLQKQQFFCLRCKHTWNKW